MTAFNLAKLAGVVDDGHLTLLSDDAIQQASREIDLRLSPERGAEYLSEGNSAQDLARVSKALQEELAARQTAQAE